METVLGGLMASTRFNGLHLCLLENMVTYFVETLVWYLHSFLHNLENVLVSNSKVGNLCLQRTLVYIVVAFEIGWFFSCSTYTLDYQVFKVFIVVPNVFPYAYKLTRVWSLNLICVNCGTMSTWVYSFSHTYVYHFGLYITHY